MTYINRNKENVIAQCIELFRLFAGVFVVLAFMTCAMATNANAAAVIYNTGAAGTASVALGINDLGALNVNDPFGVTRPVNSGETGLALKFASGAWEDSTAPGCLCEGWGVSATDGGGTSRTGYQNRSVGTAGLVLDSFTTDAAAGTGSFATSSVHLSSLPGLSVSQTYEAAPNAPGVFFVDHVSISNTTGATIDDLRYVRVMDWDIPPTEFSEFVTIKGTATTTFLETSHDDGFESSNPLAATTPRTAGTLDVDFEDSGPSDHGAYFKFNFGSLGDGESFDFDIFYGAATSEAAALAAIGAEGIELFSLGQQRGDPGGGTPATFIFGFSGVGGVPVIPGSPVPEPGTLAMLGFGMCGLGFVMRRKQAK